MNTFRPFVPRIYILQQGPRALCTRALGMCEHTCMRNYVTGMVGPRVQALGRTNFAVDGWLYSGPVFLPNPTCANAKRFFSIFYPRSCSSFRELNFIYRKANEVSNFCFKRHRATPLFPRFGKIRRYDVIIRISIPLRYRDVVQRN